MNLNKRIVHRRKTRKPRKFIVPKQLFSNDELEYLLTKTESFIRFDPARRRSL